jgi:uncharacterized flavoprotein (TIGR03862 family)
MQSAAVFGSGPAALMAATVLSSAMVKTTVFEKNKGAGRKLLIAGGSGLNISSAMPDDEFIAQFQGHGIDWRNLFQKYSVQDWLGFVQSLGLETFQGTSKRYFVREMKATNLLKRWLSLLEERESCIYCGVELTGFTREPGGLIAVTTLDGRKSQFDAIVLALGGASWLPEGEKPSWPHSMHAAGIDLVPFAAANCGFEVAWKAKFMQEAVNQPLKNVELISSMGRRKGDLMITGYGLEGTPAYAVGAAEICFIDLKPDLAEHVIAERLRSSSENLSPLRRVTKIFKLDTVRRALLFYHAPPEGISSIEALANLIKKFPLKLEARRPLAEAISSTGGVALSEIDSSFMLRKIPGVFVAGEMLDWHAPTGGFLIQACVSQGHAAGLGARDYLAGMR